MNKEIKSKYEQVASRQSDINEHIPVLKQYSEECNHITELGCRGVVSTWAFLAGNPKKLVSIDIDDCPVTEVSRLAKESGIEFEFIKADDLTIEIEETDLLFIDTLHTYEHLSKELKLHGNKARKYIIMHDTEVFGKMDYFGNKKYGVHGEGGLIPAIDEFIADNTNWSRHKVFTNNNGLTVLVRTEVENSEKEEKIFDLPTPAPKKRGRKKNM